MGWRIIRCYLVDGVEDNKVVSYLVDGVEDNQVLSC